VKTHDPLTDRQVLEVQSDLERMTVRLPSELTGRRTHGFTWERILEAIRYNRVQGAVPGLGYQVTMPGDGFTTLGGELRFGLSDERVVGGLTLTREAPGARWTLRGYREVRSNDPFSRANRLGNSFNAIFAGHDDADYYLSHGVRLTRKARWHRLELSTTPSWSGPPASGARRDRINDALATATSANPPVGEGTGGAAAARVDGLNGRPDGRRRRCWRTMRAHWAR
jgi:hypothetical protein